MQAVELGQGTEESRLGRKSLQPVWLWGGAGAVAFAFAFAPGFCPTLGLGLPRLRRAALGAAPGATTTGQSITRRTRRAAAAEFRAIMAAAEDGAVEPRHAMHVIVGCGPPRDARAQRVVDTFQPDLYCPYPMHNGHAQTIFSFLYPRSPRPRLALQHVTLPTDDGLDVIHMHVLNGHGLAPEGGHDDDGTSAAAGGTAPGTGPASSSERQPGVRGQAPKPVAVVVHGLSGSSTSLLSLRLAETIADEGFKVVLVNFRGCADEQPIPKTFKMYHAGFYEDVETVVRALRGQDVYIVGYSLGTAVLINMLGELGSRAATEYNIVAAAGMSVPFDPTSCQIKIDSGLSHAAYSTRLVGALTRKVRQLVDAGVPVPEHVSYDKVMGSKTIGELDDNYVARVYGFDDRFDYYRKTDALRHLASIHVPSYFVTARDDPFFNHADGTSLPKPETIATAPVKVYVPDHGGHCGTIHRHERLVLWLYVTELDTMTDRPDV
jgi:uncharacterized protein